MIHKDAPKVATITWSNGNTVALYVGSNRNTGALIVWQVVTRGGKVGRSRRITGGNIERLAAEIASYVPAEGSIKVHHPALFARINA